MAKFLIIICFLLISCFQASKVEHNKNDILFEQNNVVNERSISSENNFPVIENTIGLVVLSDNYGKKDFVHIYNEDGSLWYKFTSYERDNETSLDYAKARMHNYNHGRFTSPDPIMMKKSRLADPQAINLYVYARNNPLRFTDPDGKEFVDEDGRKIKVKWNKKTKEFDVTAHKKTDPKSKALADIRRMAKLVGDSGSKTAISKMTDLAKNSTKIHFSIEKSHPRLFGVHEAHDKNGNKLAWENDKFTDGKGNPVKPAYKGKNYAEASITIFEGSIENNLAYFQNTVSRSGNNKRRSYGICIRTRS